MKSLEYTRLARRLAWLICLLGVLMLAFGGLAMANALTSRYASALPALIGLASGLSLLFSGALLGTLSEISSALSRPAGEAEARPAAAPAPGATLRQAFLRARA